MNHYDKGQLDLKKLELLPLEYYKILTMHHLFVQGKILWFID